MTLPREAKNTHEGAISAHPFRWSPQVQGDLEVRVSGSLPSWLKGQLTRTAPAAFDRAGVRSDHWFDGHGLLYAFELGQGVHFRQQLLASQVLADNDRGEHKVATFGTAMRRNLWQRLLAPVPPFTDNANVNVVPWQGQWLAMTESPYQHVIDAKTLGTRGHYHYEDGLPQKLAMSAHPHYEGASGSLVNVGSHYGPRSELVVYRQGKHEHRRVVEGRLALKRVPYIHSFGLTPRHGVLIDHPLRVDAKRFLFSNKGFIRHFNWEPERGTRLWLLDRQSGAFTAFEADPLFCFHTVNAFEDGQDVVLDFLAYDDARVIDELYTDVIEREAFTALPRLMRARLTPGKRDARLEQVGDVHFELPQIAYRSHGGRRHRFVWGVQLSRDEQRAVRSELIKLDVDSGELRRYADRDCTYGEPVFVPRPGAAREDEGVLLAVGSFASAERSRLLVLNAETLEPLARCEAEVAIPLGFHGTFALAG